MKKSDYRLQFKFPALLGELYDKQNFKIYDLVCFDITLPLKFKMTKPKQIKMKKKKFRMSGDKNGLKLVKWWIFSAILKGHVTNTVAAT